MDEPAKSPYNAPILEARYISKRFGSTLALQEVSLQVYPGETLAIIGENGAGKSTLMKIISGLLEPDSGELLIQGKACLLRSVTAAQKLGIALIPQERSLCDNLSVAENMFLGRELKIALGVRRIREMETQCAYWLSQIGLAETLSPPTLVSQLSQGYQQMVEIARALSQQAKILIMDEPTSSLSQRETDRLHALIRDLNQQGTAILYISHRMRDVQEIAHRVVALRDGRLAGELTGSDIEVERMAALMSGQNRHVDSAVSLPSTEPSSVCLSVKNLRLKDRVTGNLQLTVNRGEIVALAGLVGAGRSRLARALFGLEPVEEGSIQLMGQSVSLRSPQSAIRAGIAFVPEDRQSQGLFLGMSIQENLAMSRWAGLSRSGWVLWSKVRAMAQNTIDQFRIKAEHGAQPVEALSGGNQQKVALAKWLRWEPRLLILDEPTRGVDVGSKQEIYHRAREAASRGMGVLMISSEMQELLSVPDRVIVMNQGRITGELARESLSEAAIMRLMEA